MLTYRRLSDAVPSACELAPWLSMLGDRCARIVPARVSSSSPEDAAAATDESTCTVFNSNAHPPHELVLELAEAAPLSALVLVTEQTPDGLTTHVIETSEDGARWTELGTLRGHTVTQNVYAAIANRPVSARFVRVRSVGSPSWIAFREVTLLSCGAPVRGAIGAAVPSRSPVDRSDRRFVRGRGSCERARDCVLDDCCSARSCVAREDGPRCHGVGCPRVYDPREITCVCGNGTCGAWIRERDGSNGGPGIAAPRP